MATSSNPKPPIFWIGLIIVGIIILVIIAYLGISRDFSATTQGLPQVQQ